MYSVRFIRRIRCLGPTKSSALPAHNNILISLPNSSLHGPLHVVRNAESSSFRPVYRDEQLPDTTTGYTTLHIRLEG